MDNDLNNLRAQDLNRQEVVSKIQARVNFVVRFADDEQAWPLSLALRKIRQQANKTLTIELSERLKLWSVLVDFVCFPAQTKERVVEIFHDQMKEVLTILDWEIVIGGLESRLWADPSGPREELGVALIEALKANKQILGSLALGEWIAVFIHSYPNVPNLSDFEERGFLNKNEKARSLSSKDKEVLAKLLKAYNFLRPLEAGAYYVKGLEDGRDISREAEKQARLGRALEGTVESQGTTLSRGYQGRQNLQDIRPQTQGRKLPVFPPIHKEPQSFRAIADSGRGAGSLRQAQSGPPRGSQAVTQGIKPPSQRDASLPSVSGNMPQPQAAESKQPSFQDQTLPKPKQASTPLPRQKQKQPESFSKEINAANLTVSELERIAQRGDPILEKRMRKIIHRDFNQLEQEVRRYVSNSPFWAE